MNSTITYSRDGQVRTVNILSRLIPNPLAVKFVVIEHEMGNYKDLIKTEDQVFLDELLINMNIEILDVSPTADSCGPEPYTHSEGGI